MTEIRPYRDADRAALADLMIKCDTYHGGRIPTKTSVEQELSALPAGVEVLLADEDGKIVGFSFFNTQFPAAAGQAQLYLKELFVTERYRQKNVGKELMLGVMLVAKTRGYTRLDWSTEKDNRKAQNFYQKIGAQPSDKLFYRLENDELTSVIKKLEAL